MKKYFLAGLVLFSPIAVTIFLTIWMFRLLTDPFATLFEDLFFEHLFSSPDVVYWLSRICSFILILLTFVFVGFIARFYLIDKTITLARFVLKKIPMIRSVYNASTEVVEALLREEHRGFSKVVKIKYPSPEAELIGFVPRTDHTICPTLFGGDLIPVFVPGCPNPFMGFLLFCHEKDIQYLNVKVDDAVKWTISAGAVCPDAFTSGSYRTL